MDAYNKVIDFKVLTQIMLRTKKQFVSFVF
jgi:hypothetical protein